MVVLGKKIACQTEEHTSVLLCVCVQRKHVKVEHCCSDEHAKSTCSMFANYRYYGSVV